MDISFKTKEQPESRKVSFDMPADLEALTAKCGAEYVYNAAVGQTVISLQALCRRHIEKSDEEIQGVVNSWVPGERSPAVAKSALEKATSAIKSMSAEERAELLAKLQAAA